MYFYSTLKLNLPNELPEDVEKLLKECSKLDPRKRLSFRIILDKVTTLKVTLQFIWHTFSIIIAKQFFDL